MVQIRNNFRKDNEGCLWVLKLPVLKSDLSEVAHWGPISDLEAMFCDIS